VEASIMDYGRFNYVAQPGDNARLIPIIGPYDEFAVEWGYKPFPGATNQDQEKKLLEEIAARQVKDPKLRFGDPNPGVDPTQQTEDLGSDSIRATELGLKNIDRIMDFLIKATCKPGEDYDLLEEAYTQVLVQRDRELGHVANVVGGVVQNNIWFGQAEAVFSPVSVEQQRKAVAFLNQDAFKTPFQLLRPDILQRVEPGGAAERLLGGQRRLLASLLDDARCRRLSEQAARSPENAYLLSDLLLDLRTQIWSELSGVQIQIDLYRRNLQRAFVEQLTNHANRSDTASDLPALARAELKTLLSLLQSTLPKVADAVTRAHLEDIAARIDRTLEPRGKS